MLPSAWAGSAKGRRRWGRQGVPQQRWSAGKSAKTLLRAPTTALAPMRTPGTHEAIGGHPSTVLDRDRGRFQPKGRIGDIVAAGAEIAFLGNDAVTANGNGVEAVEHHIVANPAMVADRHLPRVMEPGGGANHHPFTNAGPKQTQQKPAGGVVGMEGEGKGDRLHQPPQQDDDFGTPRVVPRLVIAPQIHPRRRGIRWDWQRRSHGDRPSPGP
jgi:hypothetical protein